MKEGLLKLLAIATCILPIASTEAVQISGDIGFTGSATFNAIPLSSATGFDTISATVVGGSQTGSYLPVPGGTVVSWTAFTFVPPAGSVTPLWTFDLGGIIYSFAATSMTVVEHTDTFLNIIGLGTAHIDGLEDTAGSWNLTVTGGQVGGQASFTFGAGANVPAVPDGGATGILVGLAVCGLAAFRKITG